VPILHEETVFLHLIVYYWWHFGFAEVLITKHAVYIGYD